MTQREQTLRKHFHHTLPEEFRDEIHDAMEEHAIEFANYVNAEYVSDFDNRWHRIDPENIKQLMSEIYTIKQLYNQFNLNKVEQL